MELSHVGASVGWLGILGDLIIGALTLSALYAMIGVGFSLSFTIGRFFDLSLGVAFLAGGYAAYALVLLSPLPLAVSMLLGVIAAGILSASLGLGLIGPLTRRLDPLSLFVATLALLYIAQAAIAMIFGDDAKVLRSGPAPSAAIGPLSITDMQATQIGAAVALLGAVLLLMRRSRLGRFARAVADNPHLARTFGFPVTSTLLGCYILAGSLAGFAGVFYAADRALDPAQAMAALLAAMVATIVGGESVGGAVAGALMLAVLETVFGFALVGNWRTSVAFTLLLIFLAIRGRGAVVVVDRRF